MKLKCFPKLDYEVPHRGTACRAPTPACRTAALLLLLLIAAVAWLGLFPLEVLARVGGGGSYSGGGGGHGGSGGDGAGGAIIGIVRILVWLTVENPAVGVPVDIVVFGLVI